MNHNVSKTHYEMLSQTSFCMRGEIKFKYKNFMKYYDYLKSGTDKQTVIGITDQNAVNCIIIDNDHQLISFIINLMLFCPVMMCNSIFMKFCRLFLINSIYHFI